MKYGLTELTVKGLVRRNWLETEMRLAINKQKVVQYAAEMKDGVLFPASVVFIDPKQEIMYVGDGFHRILAHQRNGEKTIRINLNRGNKCDAILHNIESNKGQLGLPFTWGDKGKCITTLLTMPETKNMTQTKIAELVGCSIAYTSQVVAKMEIERPQFTIDKNGRTHSNLHKEKDRTKVAERRQKVVELIYQGKSQVEIADEMDLSRSTIQRDIEEAAKQKQLVKCPHCDGSGYIKKGK